MNVSGPESGEGLGSLSTVQGEQGYFLHDTVIFTPAGIPFGVLEAQTWARDPGDYGKKAKRKQKGIGEKESYPWLRSLEATDRAQKEAPEVRWVSVGDREADIYELFERAEQLGSSFLVRSFHKRKVGKETKVWDLGEEEEPAGRVKVSVKGKDKKTREAEVEIRFREGTILNPQGERDKGEIPVWALWAGEVSPPAGVRTRGWGVLIGWNGV